MSNLYTSKPLNKPLKGGAINSNVGNFETINATSLKLETVNIAGLFEDGVLLNVLIEDSEINNTIIGLNGRNAAYFSAVDTSKDVTFNSDIYGTGLFWDSQNAQLYLQGSQGSFKVDGCSLLGNIEICRNDIMADNINGDINIIPNGGGTVYVKGPLYQQSSSGNFTSVLSNGGASFIVANDIVMYSSHGSALVTTLQDQEYSTINGDLSLNVDTGIQNTSIRNIQYSTGNISVTTFAANHLAIGNVVAISSGTLVGNYTVGSIISDTVFRLTSTSGNTNAIVTGGSLTKYPDNNILLNSKLYVKIPENTKITFGDTTNAVSGNTTGLLLQSSHSITLNPSSGNVIIPQSIPLQFGSSGNTRVEFDGTSLTATSDKVSINGELAKIDTTNTKFYDPILTVANFSSNAEDIKDRGIEFNYYDPTTHTQKLGWFGFRNSTKSFTFIPDAINNGEIITGTPGNFEYSGLSVNNINVLGSGVVDMNCGRIINVNTISGCSNNVTIAGSSNVTVYASNRIALSASTDILVPNNIPIKLGTSGSYIAETRLSNVVVASKENLEIITNSRGSIIIPVETQLSFDGTTSGTQKIVANTSGDLLIGSSKNIYLTTTGGNIIVPANTYLHFGSSAQNVVGNSAGVSLVSNSISSGINVIASSSVSLATSFGNVVVSSPADIDLFSQNVRLLEQKNLVFGVTGTTNSISTVSGGNLVVTGNSSNNFVITSFDSINLSSSRYVNIPTGTRLTTDPLSVIYTDTSRATYMINQSTSGSVNVSAKTTTLANTGGSLRVVNDNTSISSASFTLTGTDCIIDTDNVRIKDPIISIANYSQIDNKDRGIEYLQTTSSGSNLGWFGVKQSSGRFTYYSSATNDNEVITGTMGDIEAQNAFLRSGLTFTSQGNIDLACGRIVNANTITGCSGVLNLVGTTSVNITGANVNINATERVQIPSNVPMYFGTLSNISSDSAGNFSINSEKLNIASPISNIYSQDVNIQDPIVSLGGVTLPATNDLKDRGIEFKWNDSIAGKVGFFGYKNNLGRFVFIKSGTNTNEVFSGAYGDVQFNDAYVANVSLSNGEVSGIQKLSGGVVTIQATSGNVNISPATSGSVLLPYNIPLAFGSTSTSVSSTSTGNLTIKSEANTTILASTGSINLSTSEGVRLPGNVPIWIGTNNDTYILKDTSGNLNVSNSSGDINLTPKFSTGNIVIPPYNILSFGSTRNSVYSDGQQLVLNGYNGVGIISSSVTIGGNINIVGTLTATSTDFDLNKYILPLGTYQTLSITNISNASGTSGNVSITTNTLGNLNVGDTVTLKNTGSVPSIDGDYVITKINGPTSFNINASSITTEGTVGSLKSNLTTFQGKDVGIQVNYWSTTGSVAPSTTAGSVGYKTGFFGFKDNVERWSFYSNATISNNVVSGGLGDIEVNKVYTTKMSGFGLDGNISAGSNTISGTSFQIGGGSVNNTPVGSAVASTGRFTTLTNTVQASLTNVALQSNLSYSFERYTLSSVALQYRSPSDSVIVSMFSVSGTSYTTSSGTMPSTNIPDGTLKILVCSSMGTGCSHTIFFGAGKILTPNPLNVSGTPSKLIFKRKSQSAQLLWDSVQSAWILLGSGCYVE
jgi:hypothetical protein